jgi:hypothetical protein
MITGKKSQHFNSVQILEEVMKRLLIECDECGKDVTDIEPKDRQWPWKIEIGNSAIVEILGLYKETPADLCPQCRAKLSAASLKNALAIVEST